MALENVTKGGRGLWCCHLSFSRAINLVGIPPVKALSWSAILNCLIPVPVLVVIMRMATSRKVMAPLPIFGVRRATDGATTIVMLLTFVALQLSSL
ncbi:MAG TPA: hypothetical protein VKU80_10040 [Planctomycetota bacterium]|nr:hypothetical protein [Planctomycetota bacterium]